MMSANQTVWIVFILIQSIFIITLLIMDMFDRKWCELFHRSLIEGNISSMDSIYRKHLSKWIPMTQADRRAVCKILHAIYLKYSDTEIINEIFECLMALPSFNYLKFIEKTKTIAISYEKKLPELFFQAEMKYLAKVMTGETHVKLYGETYKHFGTGLMIAKRYLFNRNTPESEILYQSPEGKIGIGTHIYNNIKNNQAHIKIHCETAEDQKKYLQIIISIIPGVIEYSKWDEYYSFSNINLEKLIQFNRNDIDKMLNSPEINGEIPASDRLKLELVRNYLPFFSTLHKFLNERKLSHQITSISFSILDRLPIFWWEIRQKPQVLPDWITNRRRFLLRTSVLNTWIDTYAYLKIERKDLQMGKEEFLKKIRLDLEKIELQVSPNYK